jgi:hypothetical protein
MSENPAKLSRTLRSNDLGSSSKVSGPAYKAVEVSLGDVRVLIAEVHWLCRIPCDPLRLTCSGEKLGPASEDVGMKREAFHISG